MCLGSFLYSLSPSYAVVSWLAVDDRPHQHVDEDDDRKEDPSAAGVYAEEQDEVAEEAQDNHPHRVQLKEHVQHIQTAC